MEFSGDIYCDNGLYGHIAKFICDEFIKILKEHPEVSKFVNENHIPIVAEECYTSELMERELKWHKGHITKEFAHTMLRDWRDKERNSTMGIYTEWRYMDGKVYIASISLQVRVAPLCMDIAKKIYDLVTYKKILSWMIKHEFGHVIDYINTRHGITVDEFEEICKRDEEEYAKYYEGTTSKTDWDFDAASDDNRTYYRIPQEAAANNAVGIDVEDLIKCDKEWYDEYFNKQAKIHITFSDVCELPKEEKNET